METVETKEDELLSYKSSADGLKSTRCVVVDEWNG
jgi:hypothetical protein